MSKKATVNYNFPHMQQHVDKCCSHIMSRQLPFRLDTLVISISSFIYVGLLAQVHLRCHLLRYISPLPLMKCACKLAILVVEPLKFPPTRECRRGSYSPITYLSKPLSYYFIASFVSVCYTYFCAVWLCKNRLILCHRQIK